MEKILVLRCLSNCNVNDLVEQEQDGEYLAAPQVRSKWILELGMCSATQHQHHKQERSPTPKTHCYVLQRQIPPYEGSYCPLPFEKYV